MLEISSELLYFASAVGSTMLGVGVAWGAMGSKVRRLKDEVDGLKATLESISQAVKANKRINAATHDELVHLRSSVRSAITVLRIGDGGESENAALGEISQALGSPQTRKREDSLG